MKPPKSYGNSKNAYVSQRSIDNSRFLSSREKEIKRKKKEERRERGGRGYAGNSDDVFEDLLSRHLNSPVRNLEAVKKISYPFAPSRRITGAWWSRILCRYHEIV